MLTVAYPKEFGIEYNSNFNSTPQRRKSENSVLPRTPCTPQLCHNCGSDLFSYFKSAIDQYYGVLAGVQPTLVYLTIKPKYFIVLLNWSTMGVRRSIWSLLLDRLT